MTVNLSSEEVAARAGLGEDEDGSDLTDREKAVCVWELLEQTEEFHVRVRRANDSLWAYDAGRRRAGTSPRGSARARPHELQPECAQRTGSPGTE